MPFYTYECTACDHKFEEMRSISKMDAQIDCTECGCSECKRVFDCGSNVAVVYKGFSWGDKNRKFARDRMKKSEHMARIQGDNHQSFAKPRK